jgi:phage baseplate assembly protein W
MSASTTAPKLPLSVAESAVDSFTDAEVEDLIKQNVKMILLTHPGERIMRPDFGVGIERYLFEMQNGPASSNLRAAINSQLRKYMPSISVLEVSSAISDESPNHLFVLVRYEIDFLRAKGELELLLEY